MDLMEGERKRIKQFLWSKKIAREIVVADARRGAGLSPTSPKQEGQGKERHVSVTTLETFDCPRPSPTRSTTPAGHFHVRHEDKLRTRECIKLLEGNGG